MLKKITFFRLPKISLYKKIQNQLSLNMTFNSMHFLHTPTHSVLETQKFKIRMIEEM